MPTADQEHLERYRRSYKDHVRGGQRPNRGVSLLHASTLERLGMSYTDGDDIDDDSYQTSHHQRSLSVPELVEYGSTSSSTSSQKEGDVLGNQQGGNEDDLRHLTTSLLADAHHIFHTYST